MQMRKGMSRRTLLSGACGVTASIGLAPLFAACGAPTASAPPPSLPPSGQAAKPAEKPAPVPTKPAAPAAPAPTSAVNAPAAAAPAAAPAKAAPPVELILLNQSRGLAKALTTLSEKYGKEVGVTVTVDTPGPIDYPKKLQAASQTDTMPDIFLAGGTPMAPYLKAGWALELRSELEKGWKKNFTPVALDLIEWPAGNPFDVPPGIYDVPLEMGSLGLLSNPALLEKAKLDPKATPTTIPELMAMFTALKAGGIGPFTTAVEGIPFLIQSYVSNWLTDQEIEATHAGKLPWTSDAYAMALQLFVDLRDGGLIFNNSIDRPWAEMEKSFYNVREVGTIFDGAWSIGVQRATAPDFTAYGSFQLPKAADARHDQRSVGRADRRFAVNAKGKRVEESLGFVKWLTEKEQAEVLLEMVPLIPTNPAALVDTTKIPPQFSGFVDAVAHAQKVPTVRTQPVDEAITKGVQSLLLKEKSVSQVLEDVDKAQKG
jgi:raffinose/stachyose/melibiose transport system substrate-binding protein